MTPDIREGRYGSPVVASTCFHGRHDGEMVVVLEIKLRMLPSSHKERAVGGVEDGTFLNMACLPATTINDKIRDYSFYQRRLWRQGLILDHSEAHWP